MSECSFDGDVTGEHQVGGVVGENSGIILNCENSGKINTVTIVPSSSGGLFAAGINLAQSQNKTDFIPKLEV